MTNLHIALHDGFRNDTVVITVNGREVYRRTDVTTNLAISRADASDVAVEEGELRVEVEVPTRNLRAAITLDATQKPYLAVEITEQGSLALSPSATPFRYM